MAYTYTNGSTEFINGQSDMPIHYINRAHTQRIGDKHSEIIGVFGQTSELRDLITELLNAHEIELELKYKIKMEYIRLSDAAFMLRQEHPWVDAEVAM